MVLVAGVTIVTLAPQGSHAAPVSAGQAAAVIQQDRPLGPLRVLSVTPPAGATGVNGAAPIRVQFSAPLAASTPMPALSPHIAGRWQAEGDTAVFTPASGYFQNTHVTLKIPGGPAGDDLGLPSQRGHRRTAGRLQRHPELHHRLVQAPCACSSCSAQLGYLPLTWTPESYRLPCAPARPRTPSFPRRTSRPAGTFSGPAATRSTTCKDSALKARQHARHRRGAGLRVG